MTLLKKESRDEPGIIFFNIWKGQRDFLIANSCLMSDEEGCLKLDHLFKVRFLRGKSFLHIKNSDGQKQ